MDEYDFSKLDRKPSNLREQFNKGLTYFLVIAAAIALYFLLLRASSIFAFLKRIFELLSPVWFGFAFAYLLNPITKRCENKFVEVFKGRAKNEKRLYKAARFLGIFVALVVAVALIVLLVNMLIPQLYATIRRLIIVLPRELNELVDRVNNIEAGSPLGQLAKTLVERANDMFQQWLKGDLWGGVNELMSTVTSGLVDVVSTLFHIVIGIIIAVYILGSKERFTAMSKKVLYATFSKERANFILHLSRKSNKIFSGFLVGKIIDSAIIGVICFIVMSILRMSDEYTLLVSVIVGVTNIIPVFGPYIGAIPSALILLLENPLHGLYFIIFIVILQQLDGNIIGPKILGDSTGLSAFWVVFSILLFGGLFGFIGMLLGVPTFAVIYYIIKMVINERLRRKSISTESAKYVEMTAIGEDGSFIYDKNADEKDNPFSRHDKTENDNRKED